MTRVTATYNKISINGIKYNADNTIGNIIKLYLKTKIESTIMSKKFIELDRAETLAEVNQQKQDEAADALALMPRAKKLQLASSRLSLTDPNVIASVVSDLNKASDRLEAKRKVFAICLESGECVEQLLDKVILKDLA